MPGLWPHKLSFIGELVWLSSYGFFEELAGAPASCGEASTSIASGGPQNRIALGFAETTPDPVRLSHAECMVTASFDDWTRVADGFSALFSHGASAATFAIWVEENG